MTPAAPSNVCSMLMASLELRTPCPRAAISTRINSRTAMPAASSSALLMRRPEDNALMDSASWP